jgi:uncharacterized protein (TIGR02646 family)
MRVALLQAVRQQYGFACGYCSISETEAGATLTVDHFQPRSQGGSNDFANLVYCCHACNEHKGDYWNPDSEERILHPINDDLASHYALQVDGNLTPLTETGAFHITRLQLNRPALVRHRRTDMREEQDRRDYHSVAQHLSRIEAQLSQLNNAIRALRSGGE